MFKLYTLKRITSEKGKKGESMFPFFPHYKVQKVCPLLLT